MFKTDYLRIRLPVVRGDTSLFIPGFDPQPLSVGDLGTDGQGRTTWEIVPGSLTGTFTEPAFVGTGTLFIFPLSAMSHSCAATLVEGPNDAHLIYGNEELSMTLDIQCGISNSIAACTGDAGYDVTPLIFPTQTAQPFVVQGGGPLTVSSPSQTTPSVLPAQTPTSSGFITTSVPSSLTTSTASSSSGLSNDGISNSIVAIPLVIGFAVMTVVLS